MEVIMAARLIPFPRCSSPDPSPDRPPTAAKIRDLRTAIWLTPFLNDGDTRAQLLRLADDIAADLDRPYPAAACGGVR